MNKAASPLVSLLTVGGSIVAMCFAMNLLLWSASYLWPDWLPDQAAGVGWFEDMNERVLAASEELQQGTPRSNHRFVTMIGLSNLREGVDLEQLDREDGVRCLYLGLGGAGVDLQSLHEQTASLRDSQLSPDLLVVAVSPFHFVGRQHRDNAPIWLKLIRQGGVRNYLRALMQGLWLRQRSQDIQILVSNSLRTVRSFLLGEGRPRSAKGQQAGPWRDMVKLCSGVFPESSRRFWLQRYGENGFYEPANYESGAAEQARQLLPTLQTFKRRGSKILVVFLPEHSELRREIPSNASQIAKIRLRSLPGFADLKIIDFRDSVDDSGFVEISHMNAAGRADFTAQLAAKMKAWLEQSP